MFIVGYSFQISIYSNICIGVFSQFHLHTCTYQNYIEEPPNPRETSERMNFNVIDKKQLIWNKWFIELISCDYKSLTLLQPVSETLGPSIIKFTAM
jgi:hypothetical protein